MEKRLVPAFAEARAYPLPEEVAAVIDDRTRAIVLCSPNNPTGAIYPAHIIEGFYDLAKARGIALIIDETYKDFRSSPEPLHGLFAKPDWQDTFVQLYSFSKVFAMTGYRVGSIIAGAKVLAEAEKILDCMAICAPQISQRAALFGLAHLEDWKREKQRLMETRRAGPAGRLHQSQAVLQAHQLRRLFRLCEASLCEDPGQVRGHAAGGRA